MYLTILDLIILFGIISIYLIFHKYKTKLKIHSLHSDVLLPTIANYNDAGLDIYLYENEITIPAKDSISTNTGLTIAIPYGYYGKIMSISNISFIHGIEVGAGIINSGFLEKL